MSGNFLLVATRTDDNTERGQFYDALATRLSIDKGRLLLSYTDGYSGLFIDTVLADLGMLDRDAEDIVKLAHKKRIKVLGLCHEGWYSRNKSLDRIVSNNIEFPNYRDEDAIEKIIKNIRGINFKKNVLCPSESEKNKIDDAGLNGKVIIRPDENYTIIEVSNLMSKLGVSYSTISKWDIPRDRKGVSGEALIEFLEKNNMISYINESAYDTLEVACLLDISRGTLNRLFDSGKLKGFRLPPAGHRRIPLSCLLEFVSTNDEYTCSIKKVESYIDQERKKPKLK